MHLNLGASSFLTTDWAIGSAFLRPRSGRPRRLLRVALSGYFKDGSQCPLFGGKADTECSTAPRKPGTESETVRVRADPLRNDYKFDS
jgi:hypothetical protein